jgi:hypothetical protein
MFMQKKLAIPLLFAWGEIVYLKPVVTTLLVPIGIFDVALPALTENSTRVNLEDWTHKIFDLGCLGSVFLWGLLCYNQWGTQWGFILMALTLRLHIRWTKTAMI